MEKAASSLIAEFTELVGIGGIRVPREIGALGDDHSAGESSLASHGSGD